MANLVDTIRDAIPADTVDRLAGRLNESPQATGSALHGIIPVILAAVAGQVQGGGAAGVIDLIRGALSGGNPLDRPDALVDAVSDVPVPAQPGGVAASLLGPSFGPIVSQLAERFDLRSDSIRSLLGVGGLLGLGGIGRALGGNPTPQGLSELVRSERSSIAAALPAGVGGLLGPLDGAAGAAAARVEDRAGAAGGGIGKWLPWILLALAIIVVLIGMKSCNRQRVELAATNTTEIVPPDETVPAVAPEPAAAMPAGSGVVSALRDGRPALTVYFDVGKADVSNDLAAAAAPLKDYLAANPGASLAVSGFNDPTGNAAVNAALSKDRAQRVAAALEATGIPAASIALEKPADTNATGATDAESRRVEVTIKQ